ncbi:MAG: dihydrodipicolinate synthase family protein [Atopobiaceae bacterium]|jgi:4-hydroxy-tetrahydrodipicolinate synthase|nr:dihydrodipicolinate synthase family protein [Atopobiaceae bacterium]MCI2172674.1 dihydrodipicolinate synthase family protein [Atopobiaceae bacterium]MCI2206981.1 dihydrodipicolinate synthase family protein [Atopobiaceae bacterium]
MSRFSGIITPMVTPFNRDADQTINYDAADELIEKLIAGGVSGIFIFGSNGEFHVVTEAEKLDFAEFVIAKVAHRVPVYVGTGCCSTRETIRLSQEMEALGADCLSVINPYFIQPTDDEIVDHYTAVAGSVRIPVMLYNIPKTTGKNLSKEVVSKLATLDNVAGIKDSSGDMDNLADYLDAADGHDMEVLVGSDSKIAKAVGMGATAAIAGTSNLITEQVVSLYDAAAEGRDTTELQAALEPLRDVLHLGTVPSMLKRSVELSGIAVGPARFPASDSTPEKDEKIKGMLGYYGIPVRG